MLFQRPQTLTIFPGAVSLAQALWQAPGTCQVTHQAVTLEKLWPQLGMVPGGRYLSASGGQLIVRTLLLRSTAAFGRLGERGRDPVWVRQVHSALGMLRRAGVTTQALRGHAVSPALRDLMALL